MSISCLLLLGAMLSPATDTRPDVARTLAPFLDERAVAVLRVELRAVDAAWITRQVKDFARLSPLAKAGLESTVSGLLKGLIRIGVHDAYGILNTTDQPGLLVIPLPKGVKAKAVLEQLAPLQTLTGVGFEEVRGAIIGGGDEARRRLKEIKPVARPELALALAAAGAGSAQLAIFPSAQTRRIVAEIMPTLPVEAGGASMRPLTQGLQWAALTLRERPKRSLRLIVQTPGHEEAETLRTWLAGVLKALAKDRGVLRLFPHIGESIPRLLPKVDGDRLTETYTLEK